MSSKAAEDNCKKLCALGFSKTRALKALKDAGNSFSLAKEMLEKQKQQSDREMQQQELIRKRQQDEEEKRKLDAERKAAGIPDPSHHAEGTTTANGDAKKKERLHPCIVQYKSCRYGKFCLLKDLPGDVCISYFNSACIYGSTCRNRHTIDGVDVRHYVPNAPNAPRIDDGVLHRQEDGGVVVASEYMGGGVQLAEVKYPAGRPQPEQRQHAMPPDYQWNVVRGSEASYSDPLQAVSSIWGNDDVTAVDGPQPFLDSLKQARNGPHTPVAQHIHAVEPASPTMSRTVRYGEPGFMAHPCLLQCGGCKYGDGCMHASRPADICVFFLNGRCNYAPGQCRYRHDDVMTMAASSSMQALANRCASTSRVPHSTTSPAMAPARQSPHIHSASSASPSVGFVLKPNTVMGGQPMSMWSLSDSCASKEQMAQAALERQYAPPRHHPNSHGGFASHSEQQSGASRGAVGLHTLHGVYNNSNPVSPPPRGSSTPASPQLPGGYSVDEERRAFSALREVFPDTDPQLLLHALRLAHGDRHRVAEALAATHACDSTQQLECMLNQEVCTEDPELHTAQCSSDGLLSLCAVFPNLEPSVIEDAIQRSEGDVGAAFSALVGSTEHITSSSPFGNQWSTVSSAHGADLLKMQRLVAMFKDLPEDVVCQCFDACERSTQKAITALTQLTDDVRSMEARMHDGDEAMRGLCHSSGGANTTMAMDSNSNPQGGGSFSVTSDGSSDVGGFSVVGSAPLPSTTELYHSVAQEALEHGDWRRTRERAYFVNACRIRLLGMASVCYASGDGATAKQLSRKAASLGTEYRKLNMIAMRALEAERDSEHGVSVLDLHGFHVDEAIDVVQRRLQLCISKFVPKLKIIVGLGVHSVRGKSTVFPAVLQELRDNASIAAVCQIVSVKPAMIEVRIRSGRGD